ncbi:MAG: pyridoxal-phosphate dependent enzyme [Candidatus Lokiarchaeota archaeon]|nr:pyridoxal-phosphate dependent enzyme [Candidatus Harpocratesius repetitus]
MKKKLGRPNRVSWKSKPFCNQCKIEWEEPFLWCPECNSLLEIPPINAQKNQKIDSLWAFSGFFPNFSRCISLNEGFTSIIDIKNIPDLKKLKMKLEFRNPTGSFRDRAAALLVSDALSRKFSEILTVSTGSFSISIAAYTARAGLKSINFIPENIELTKIEQMKIYGSEVRFQGKNLGETMQDAQEYLKKHYSKDLYVPLPNQNILTIEGQKSIGLEIALQNPDIENVVVPRGSGTLLYSLYKGFIDARESGWIDRIPRIFAVALKKSADSQLVESLDINDPMLLSEVSRILQETGGKEIPISGQKMAEQAIELAKNEGIFIEPASASVIAGVRSMKENLGIELPRTLTLLTGSGINAMNLFASQMRDVKKVLWGVTATSTKKFEILRVIAERKAQHGYGIWVVLGKRNSIQSIYQHITQLEKENLIINTQPNKKRANFELTDKGKETFLRMRELIEVHGQK